MIAPVNCARAGKVALESESRQLRHLRGDFVGNDRNHAPAAERNNRERDGVIAGKHDEVILHSVENRSHLRDVARGFLDANDVFNFGEALYRAGLDVHAGAALHAVKNDGQRNGFGDGAIVLEESLLSGLVLIGRHGEDAICAKGAKLARKCDDLRGVVASCAGQNRNTSLGEFDGDLHDAKMLFVRERGALTRGSTRNKKVNTRINLPLDQYPQLCFVQRSIAAKGSDKRSARARKHGISPYLFKCLTAQIQSRRPRSVSLELRHSNSLRISLNSKKPFLPTIHRAACRAPCANPSRLRAVCRSVIVSTAESKPISCVPGCVPARLALRLTCRA